MADWTLASEREARASEVTSDSKSPVLNSLEALGRLRAAEHYRLRLGTTYAERCRYHYLPHGPLALHLQKFEDFLEHI